MQLSLSCSAQASQLIQSRPSRAGTKPELINLPEPIWVLQESLGTALCLLVLRAEGVCAQLCLAPHEGQLCWQGLSNPQSSGELAQTPAHPQASAGLCQGLSERSAAASCASPVLQGPCRAATCGRASQPCLRLNHTRHSWGTFPGSLTTELHTPMENSKATAKWQWFEDGKGSNHPRCCLWQLCCPTKWCWAKF